MTKIAMPQAKPVTKTPFDDDYDDELNPFASEVEEELDETNPFREDYECDKNLNPFL